MDDERICAWLASTRDSAPDTSSSSAPADLAPPRKRPRTSKTTRRTPLATTLRDNELSFPQIKEKTPIHTRTYGQRNMRRIAHGRGRPRAPQVPASPSLPPPDLSDEPTAEVDIEEEDEENRSAEATPKPTRKRPRTDPSTMYSASGSEASSFGVKSSASTPSRRSSPSKKPLPNIGLSHFLETIEITPEEWAERSDRIPEKVFELLRLIGSYRSLICVISKEQREDYAADSILQAMMTMMAEPEDEPIPSSQTGKTQGRQSRASFGRSPSIAFMDRIKKESLRHERSAGNEAGWNCFVHGPVLSKALELSTSSHCVEIDNV